MNNKILAAIDIGSYNCRLVIVKNFREIKTMSIATNLIKNLSFSNEFNKENISKTIDCLILFSKKMLEYKVEKYRCIATEACRQVINSDYFINEVKRESALSVEIISSDEEARLCFKSCRKYLDKIEKGVLFDIGGGSTEFSIFDVNKGDFSTKSISFGVINFSEKQSLYGKEKILFEINKHFKLFKSKFIKEIDVSYSLGCCSTISTLCALYKNLSFFDKKKIEGSILKVEIIKELILRIRNYSIDEMLNHPCIKERYPLLLNGIEILEQILVTIPIKNIVVSQAGLTNGIIEDLNLLYEKN